MVSKRESGGSGNHRRDLLIPLDGSRTAARAFGAAAAMARLLRGTLHVVHVGEKTVPEEKLPSLLEIGQPAGVKVIYHQISGEAVNAILELAVEIDAGMIIMSSHGKTHNAGLVGGSVAMMVIQHTDIPVMVIRPAARGIPESHWRPARMLVLHDGSPVTAAEVDHILSLAGLMGVDVDVLYVGAAGARPKAAGAFAGPRYLDRPHYDWSGWAEEFLRRFATRMPEVGVNLAFESGDIIETALDYAQKENDDLIALIWHGRLEGKRAATVKGVLKRTPVPVLLKRTK